MTKFQSPLMIHKVDGSASEELAFVRHKRRNNLSHLMLTFRLALLLIYFNLEDNSFIPTLAQPSPKFIHFTAHRTPTQPLTACGSISPTVSYHRMASQG